jgi:hypothetical protein
LVARARAVGDAELGEHGLRGDGVEFAAEVEDGCADLNPAGFQRRV